MKGFVYACSQLSAWGRNSRVPAVVNFLVAWLPVPADPGDRILHPATPLRLYPSTRPIPVEQI
ncbi:hypothetical protein D9613_012494 [Agrocybe pediades]|uniref:Uncharacterized protein n=1 Tax=Agrocybe pediades TaxID=84607 RepID=A0A8H4QR40_9AGAR|nr:hypothetical protein D9613_012494 [Agrocybe pediades]